MAEKAAIAGDAAAVGGSEVDAMAMEAGVGSGARLMLDAIGPGAEGGPEVCGIKLLDWNAGPIHGEGV